MRTRAAFCAIGFVTAMAGCNSEPVDDQGIPGAGVKTEIVDVSHDSTGYTVKFRMTNRDTADVGYGACTGVVEVPAGSGWASVTHWGQCQMWLGLLPPGRSITLAIPGQELAPGTQVRVALSWTFARSQRSGVGLSITDPVVVP